MAALPTARAACCVTNLFQVLLLLTKGFLSLPKKEFIMKKYIASLMTLLLLAGCGNDTEVAGGNNSNTPKQKPQDNNSKITRAANPGEIPMNGALKKETFQNISLAYLLAAAEGDLFSKQYAAEREQNTGITLPDSFQRATEALVKHIRSGGKAADAQEHFKVLTEQNVGFPLIEPKKSALGYSIIPGATRYGGSKKDLQQYPRDVYAFVYEVWGNGTSKQSLADLFKERDYDITTYSKGVSLPLQKFVSFTNPPTNIIVELEAMMKEKDVTVSPTITLPGKCTAQGKDATYKLVGAFRHPGEYYKKNNTSINPDKLEGITYFCWGNEWYKLTSTNPTPTKVPADEAQTAAEKSGYPSNSFWYMYTLQQ